jgi:hypothetical protein
MPTVLTGQPAYQLEAINTNFQTNTLAAQYSIGIVNNGTYTSIGSRAFSIFSTEAQTLLSTPGSTDGTLSAQFVAAMETRLALRADWFVPPAPATSPSSPSV